MPTRKSKPTQAKAKTPSKATKDPDEQPPKSKDTTEAPAKPQAATEFIKNEATANGASATVPSKRKAKPTPVSTPNKAPRRSARGAPTHPIDQTKVLQFLLSPAAIDLARPTDEHEDLSKRGADIKTYSSMERSSYAPSS